MNISQARDALASDNVIRLEAVETQHVENGQMFFIWIVPGTNFNMDVSDRFLRTDKGEIRYWKSLQGVLRAIEKIGAPDFWVRRL